MRRVRRCVRDEAAGEPRDRELLLLMAWSGLLAPWLSRDERRLALRRIQDGQAPATPGLSALATLLPPGALVGESGFGDFGGGDAAGLDAGAASDSSGGQ